ncbi:MAG: hypothetical protein NZ656_06625, partial [Nitrospinaceae bacterium]|nr:hypothetical protein [Nitrospinaceae bacterium]
MGKTRLAVTLSTVMILAGIASIVVKGGLNLSIDFKGGTLVAVNYTEDVDITEVRSVLANVSIDGQLFDFSHAEIKHFGDESNIAVRIPSLEDEPDQFPQKFVDNMANAFPNRVPEDENDFILSIEKVGPKIGAELSGDAVMAIIWALLLILIYISFRFEFKFAVGAIMALSHDILVTLGI